MISLIYHEVLMIITLAFILTETINYFTYSDASMVSVEGLIIRMQFERMVQMIKKLKRGWMRM